MCIHYQSLVPAQALSVWGGWKTVCAQGGAMGRQHRGSGGLLPASQAVSGVLCPARLRTGPCRAARVCVPAINIDGVDSAQVCPCRGDWDVNAVPAVWAEQRCGGESTEAESSVCFTGRWDPSYRGWGVGSGQVSKPRDHKPVWGTGQTCSEPKSCG